MEARHNSGARTDPRRHEMTISLGVEFERWHWLHSIRPTVIAGVAGADVEDWEADRQLMHVGTIGPPLLAEPLLVNSALVTGPVSLVST
jgi:hypothetical protein